MQDRLLETAAQPQEEDSRYRGAGTSKPKGNKIFLCPIYSPLLIVHGQNFLYYKSEAVIAGIYIKQNKRKKGENCGVKDLNIAFYWGDKL